MQQLLDALWTATDHPVIKAALFVALIVVLNRLWMRIPVEMRYPVRRLWARLYVFMDDEHDALVKDLARETGLTEVQILKGTHWLDERIGRGRDIP